MGQKVRAIANKVLSMKFGGFGLDGEAKDRFNKIELRLSEISLSFAIIFECRGCPSSANALWANNYAIAVSTLQNKAVADPENGPGVLH
jgi:hypothetical protein